MTTKRVDIWRAVSVLPPALLGLGGAVILALEGRLYETALVVVLVAFHRYSAILLKRPRASAEEVADWSAANVMTTVGCYALPFFIAATIH
jgi:hypothetical protein